MMHYISNCPGYRDGDSTAENYNDVNCQICINKFDGLVENRVIPTEESDVNPFEFYAAYLPGEGTQRHYLSNGKPGAQKGIRLFRSKQAAQDYIQAQRELLMDQLEGGTLLLAEFEKSNAMLSAIVIHPVEGKLAMPAEDMPTPKEIQMPRFRPNDHLKPITTLHRPSVPTPVELLLDYERRKKKRKRYH